MGTAGRMVMHRDWRTDDEQGFGKLAQTAAFLAVCTLWVWTNMMLVNLSDKLTLLRMDYSSHNAIECREVNIFHSENYDVAEGSGVLRERNVDESDD
jgi:hypothetical protein